LPTSEVLVARRHWCAVASHGQQLGDSHRVLLILLVAASHVVTRLKKRKGKKEKKKIPCSHRFNFALLQSPAATALALSPSPWVPLRLLQALSQCYDVRYFSMAPTIVTGFLTCVCRYADFDFRIFSRMSFPARRLLRHLLNL
jgi:hypothetical protein